MVSLTITTSGLSDGTQIDASDVLTPVNELKVHLENTLNGVQNFDQQKFTDASELTINVSGAITITQSYHKVDTYLDAASSNLDTISGGSAGDILYLRAENTARTSVIRHLGGGTGNIRTRHAGNVSMDETFKAFQFIFDGTNWMLVGGVEDFGSLTQKTLPDAEDLIVLEDSAVSFLKKKATLASLFPMAILRDEKSTGTAGGTSVSTTWNNRNLNTETYDPSSIVTISSNTFIPVAGDYILRAKASAGATAAAPLHRLRLFNVTGAVSVEEGLNAAAALTAGIRSVAEIECAFSANGTDAYRIDHYTSTGLATSGLGLAVSDGSPEVYLEVVLTKIG